MAGRAKTKPAKDDRARYRQHGIVLAVPLARAVALAGAGAALLTVGWPFSPAGAVLLAAGALSALRAVWRWERTRLFVSDERLVVVHGTLRRRSASASLSGAVEVDQTLPGRLLGYGTVVAGDLEVRFVPRDLLSSL